MIPRSACAGSYMSLNPILCSELRPRCIARQFFCDTVIFVQMHPLEAV